MTLMIFGLVSLIVLYFGNKEPSIFVVKILSSFFIYYLVLALLGIDLRPGETLYIYLFFYASCIIFLLMRNQKMPREPEMTIPPKLSTVSGTFQRSSLLGTEP